MTHREHRRGGSRKAQLPERLASGEPAGLAANVYPTPRLQKDPLLPLLALIQDSFLSICPASSQPTLGSRNSLPFFQSLSFTPGLIGDTPWSFSLQTCPASPFWGSYPLTLTFQVIPHSSPAPKWAPELGVACPALSLENCRWGESPWFPGNPSIPQTLPDLHTWRGCVVDC